MNLCKIYYYINVQAEVGLRIVLQRANIAVRSHVFKTEKDPTTTVNDLFVSPCLCCYILSQLQEINVILFFFIQFENEDNRIFFLNSYSRPARKIICAVSYTYTVIQQHCVCLGS